MAPVNMMVSFTLCCTKPLPTEARNALAARGPALPWRARLLPWCRALAWLLALVLLGTTAVRAQDTASGADAVSGLRLEHSDEGLYLSAQLLFKLPALVEDALYKGIPMYFVMEAEVARERWYWTDRQVALAERYLRLSYQPLTRRWRLNASASPLVTTGLGVSLSQNFPSLDEALAAMGRFAHWNIASSEQLNRLEGQNVQFSFEIDSKQLPRPFLIGQAGNADWTLSTTVLEPIPAKSQP